MAQKRFIYCVAGILVCIIVGIFLGITLTKKNNGKNASDSSSSSNTETDENLPTDKKPTKSSQLRTTNTTSTVVTDPSKDVVALTMLAIGDFGSTKDKPGSCCSRTKFIDTTTERYKVDYWAQYNTANLLAQSAAELLPKAIIGHGDNVYFNGVGSSDSTQRMQQVFENVYIQPSLKGIPWFNVVGNHDLGGANYLCGPSDGNFVECPSTEALITALRQKFLLQANYKSPDNDRWHLKDHYYKEMVKSGDITVEIYNVDTNYADVHGATQICCQCYGYTKGDSTLFDCNTITRGHKYCAGGNTDVFDACYAEINQWSMQSIASLKKDLAVSKATFKVINSHYSPHFHMTPEKMKVWYDITKQYNVQLFLNGHTHGFNHDISTWGTHFFENGAGGGIQSETSGNRPAFAASYVTTQWIASGSPYGFMELSFTKNNIKVQWVTFDDKWVFNVDKTRIIQGGIQRGHCWYVPQKPGKGVPC